jgi:alpha-L-rhamnosidase
MLKLPHWLMIAVLSTALAACGDNSTSSSKPDSPENPETPVAIDISATESNWNPTAKWLGRDNQEAVVATGEQPLAPLFRKEFDLGADSIKKATMRIASYGLYVAYINGIRVGDQVLDPPPSYFPKEILYTTYDVKSMLTSGANAIGFKLGRGHLGAGNEAGLINLKYRGEPKVLSELAIEYTNGTKKTIVTDDTWYQKDSGTRDAIMYGESHDAASNISNWNKVGSNTENWAKATVQSPPTESITPRKMAPIRIVDTIEPVKYMPLSDTSGVYDFGKITAGWAKIKVTGKSGLKVSLKFGEQLNADGTVYIHDSIGISPLVNLDTYIVGGASEEIWEPDFTRHGFRYVQVEFSEQPSSFDIQARVAYSDL